MKIEFYQDHANLWRWRVVAENGKIIGSASESFASRQSAERNAQLNGYKW